MKKTVIKIRAVIFDMDGVITNTMPDHYRVWKNIFAENNIRVTPLDVYRREGQPGIDSVLEIFKERGKPVTLARARTILRQKETNFKKIVRRRFIPGARQFLKELKKTGFRLALVTGTSRHELHRILPENIYGLFEVCITGNDVKNGKPHPEPFRRAIRKLNIAPGDAVVIENAPFGIASAKAAGLKCLAIDTSLPKEFLKGADQILMSFRDLKKRCRFVLPKGKRA